jgi:hypothetical protein
MAVNRYPAICAYCNGKVPANGGTMRRNAAGNTEVAHLSCKAAGRPAVHNMYSPVTGNSWTQNRAGRCEDAPCCGCCS